MCPTEMKTFNDSFEAGGSNDESNESHAHRKRVPLLFRGGFFRLVGKDGMNIKAECLICKHGHVYSGRDSNSNFVKHLAVRVQNIQMWHILIQKKPNK